MGVGILLCSVVDVVLVEAAAIVCVPLMSRWSLTMRTLVSWCMWSVSVVAVQPVIIIEALFCIVISVLWCSTVRLKAPTGPA